MNLAADFAIVNTNKICFGLKLFEIIFKLKYIIFA